MKHIIIKGLLVVFNFLLLHEKSISQTENLQDSISFYYNKNDLRRAIFFGEKIISDNSFNHEYNDSSIADVLSDLGYFYKQQEDYVKADSLYSRSKEIRKRIYGVSHLSYAHILNMFSGLYISTGQYENAISVTNESIEIFKEKVGLESNEYANALNTLANVYVLSGDYNKAEAAQLQSLEIRKKVKGENDNLVGISESNIAVIYSELGNEEEAEIRNKNAINIFEKNAFTNNFYYANALGNLGSVFSSTGRYKSADSIYKKTLELKGKIFGRQHNAYALAINEQAYLYLRTGRMNEAEELFLKALEIRRKAVGELHPDYAVSLKNLAALYFYKDSFLQAENLFLKALAITEKNFGKENKDYLGILNGLADIYNATGSYKDAARIFEANFLTEKRMLLNQLEFLTERELLHYIKSYVLFFDLPYTTLWNYKSSQLARSAYNTCLLLKGLTLQNSKNLNFEMESSKDSLMISQWKVHKNTKVLLNRLLTQPISTRKINTDSLNEIVNQQEKYLLNKSIQYRSIKEGLDVEWKEIQKKIGYKEIAIEFVKFVYLKRSPISPDTTYYAALLLRPQDTVPIFVKICDEEQLKKALQVFQYKTPGNYKPETKSKEASQDIYNLIWQPLEKYLTETHTVYFSPDGLLHQIAFAAIPYKNGLLCDKYNLVQLTSTRQIAIKDPEPQPSFAALFGGVNYNRQTTDTTIAHPDAYAYVYRQNRSANIDSFNYLPGTVQEVSYIKKDLTTQNKTVYLFSGTHATEAAFRHLGDSTSPQIIHFATHGFTLPDPVKNIQAGDGSNVFKISDNPLLRCGLVMAGGNKGWKGKSSPEEDDGILTGLEISNVSLLNTQLAVLSACETGTGQLMGTEGVFGLQRAFKLAGVNYVMASLWPVPDKETTEFMKYFYDNLSGGKSIRQSFISTQQTMRKKYSPYYWAAFTLVQ